MLILSEFVKGSSGNPVFLAGGCVFNSQELLRNHVEHARIVCIHFHATTRSPARPRRFSTISNSGCAQPNPRWSADAKNEQIIFRHWPMPQCRKIKTFAFQVCTFRRENGWGEASISRSPSPSNLPAEFKLGATTLRSLTQTGEGLTSNLGPPPIGGKQ